jgi:hypothetical protein
VKRAALQGLNRVFYTGAAQISAKRFADQAVP